MSKPTTERCPDDLPILDASSAASLVPTDGTVLVSGFGSVGYPKSVPLELANDGRSLTLTIVSGGSVGKEIDGVLVEAGHIDRRFPYQAQPESREAINNGDIRFHDRQVYGLGDEVQHGGMVDPDIAIIESVAAGNGWLIPSMSIGHTPAFIDSVDRLIVELNTTLPLSLQRMHDVYRPQPPPNRRPIPLPDAGDRIGAPRIKFNPNILEAVVYTDRQDGGYTFRNPTTVDKSIAENFISFFKQEINRTDVFSDQVCLQFGVGSLGNALMSALSTMDIRNRELIYYGEVLQDGLLDMIDSHRLQSASATSLALSSTGQDRLFEHIDRYAEDIVLRPADISNNPAIIDRLGLMAINSALEVDIYGHVNSTHLNGRRLVNGIGGSADFNRNAFVTVIVLPSTASNGEISRITPMVSHVDHTEHDIDVIITECGIADLRGLSPIERAEVIIEKCAHPNHREQIRTYTDKAQQKTGNIPHDLESVFSWRSG